MVVSSAKMAHLIVFLNNFKERVRKMQIVWISKAEIRPITGQNWFWIISKRDLDVKLDECSPQYFHKIQIFKDDKWWRFTIKETIYSLDSTDINLGRLGLCLDEKIDLWFQKWKTMRIGWARSKIYIETTIVAEGNFRFKIWRIRIWAEKKRNG